jgi:hypothetical protein
LFDGWLARYINPPLPLRVNRQVANDLGAALQQLNRLGEAERYLRRCFTVLFLDGAVFVLLLLINFSSFFFKKCQ